MPVNPQKYSNIYDYLTKAEKDLLRETEELERVLRFYKKATALAKSRARKRAARDQGYSTGYIPVRLRGTVRVPLRRVRVAYPKPSEL